MKGVEFLIWDGPKQFLIGKIMRIYTKRNIFQYRGGGGVPEHKYITFVINFKLVINYFIYLKIKVPGSQFLARVRLAYQKTSSNAATA